MEKAKIIFLDEKGDGGAGCIIALLILIVLILVFPPVMKVVLDILFLKFLFD